MTKHIRINELPPKLRKQAEEQLSVARRQHPCKDAKPECNPQHALETGTQTPQISQKVYLVVLLYRVIEGFDLDNSSIKPHLDGVVERGLVKDDSSKIIVGLLKLARKVATKEEERTVLEFWDSEFFEPYITSARRNANCST